MNSRDAAHPKMHTIVQHVKSCPLCFQFLWQRSKSTSQILEDHYLFLSVFNDSSMLTKIRMKSPRPLQKDDIDVCLHCQSLSAPDGFPANWVAHCAAPRFDSSSQQPPVADYLGTWLNKKLHNPGSLVGRRYLQGVSDFLWWSNWQLIYDTSLIQKIVSDLW